MDAFVSGIELLMRWDVVLALMIGSVGGVIIGAIPGVGAAVAIAILLPATFSLDPIVGLTMLLGIYGSSMYGGALPAIEDRGSEKVEPGIAEAECRRTPEEAVALLRPLVDRPVLLDIQYESDATGTEASGGIFLTLDFDQRQAHAIDSDGAFGGHLAGQRGRHAVPDRGPIILVEALVDEADGVHVAGDKMTS